MPYKPPRPPTELGPARDAWLAEWLMEWSQRPSSVPDTIWWVDQYGACAYTIDAWHPSTSTALALDEVVKAMVRHGYWWNANDDTEAEGHVYWEFGKANTCFGSAAHPTIAGAVCLAASQARYAELTR